MRRKLNIPSAVVADIASRLKESIEETIDEMGSALEDEDTLTGHLGARLTTKSRRVDVTDDEIRGVWTWSLRYTKFRGRGAKATESYVGADGIFELTLDGFNRTEIKSILFQSKMEHAGAKDLVEQCAKLSTWREAAFVINFAHDAISATTIDQALAARGVLKQAESMSLDAFLVDRFVACLVGDNDLRYIRSKRSLVWDSVVAGRVSANFDVKHRLSIKVKPPLRSPYDLAIGQPISASDILLHRMEATFEEVLSSKPGIAVENPKREQRALSRIYHPDFYGGYSSEVREVMTLRMQEINDAFDHFKKK